MSTGSQKGCTKEKRGVSSSGRVCAQCKVKGTLESMKRCGRCKRVSYCSSECQKQHWKHGGHRDVCEAPGTEAKSTAPTKAVAWTPEPREFVRVVGLTKKPEFNGLEGQVQLQHACADDRVAVLIATAPPRVFSLGIANIEPVNPPGLALKHPCPICTVREDDGIASAMCLQCGQLWCAECNGHTPEGLRECPTCRTKVSQLAVSVKRARKLVARAVGRYTARAEAFLGDCALNGQGLRRDPVEAVRWYRRAADRGLAAAQNGMGVALGQGKGVPRDDAAAVAWFRRAASQGHPEAEFNLAMCYARGLGVAMSPTEALALTSHAAVRGHPDAQYTLGLWFEEGKATLPCDQAAARQWYQRARTQGHKDAIAKTMHKHKVLDPKTFKPTTPTNSAWADGLSTNERYEWMGNCYAMRCDDDYVWGGGILRGPRPAVHLRFVNLLRNDPQRTLQSLTVDFLMFSLLATRHGVTPEGWNWPSFLNVAPRFVRFVFTKSDAKERWGSENIFSGALSTSPGSRSLRYTGTRVYGRCYQRPQPFNDAKSSQMFDQATIDAGRGVCADNAALNEVGGAEQWIKFVEELRPHLPSV